MIKEIKNAQLEKLLPKKIFIFNGESVWTLSEYLEDVRILVDDVEEPAPDPKEKEAPEQPRQRRNSKELEREILKAWDKGNRTISQIMNITGCTYATVKRYLP